jgi:alpha-L-rhamnosidase
MKVLFLFSLILICAPARADSPTDSLNQGTRDAPIRLSCELLLEPSRTVIYDSRPEFAWECGTGDRAYLQSACQIVVRDAAKSNPMGEVVWDSGRIDGADSLNIEYDGSPLRAGQEYEWRVRAWNSRHQITPWSKPQRFRMADRLSAAGTSRYPMAEVLKDAQSIQEISDGNYLVDFGTAAFGYLKLHMAAVVGPQELQVIFGEKLAAGRIDRKPGGTIRAYRVGLSVAPQTAQLEVRPPQNKRNTSGDAVPLPEWVGVVAPFRYVEISGLTSRPENHDVVQVRIEYPFDEGAAAFESSDATLNAVWQLCKYSIRATTFCGVYVDGDRERIPYEADAYINQLSHYGVDREYALARYSHEYLLANPTWPTEWKQHSVLMAFADYWYTGDSESLVRCYEALKRDKVLTAAERADGLLDTSEGYRDIVDWPEAERDGYELLPVNTVVNAFHYATLKRMAHLAEVMGREQDQSLFAQKAERLKIVFNDIFWNHRDGRYVDGEGSLHSSMHANLFPLAFGIVPQERRQSVVDFIKSRDMKCSVYAAQYLLEGLYRADEDRYALELLTSRSKRSWFNMIRSGSTIALETWDQDFKPNLDWNHAWGAAPANLIPTYLVGVRPEEPGFKKIVIQPRPGDLKHFRAKVPSPRGAIHVDFSHMEDEVSLDIEVPGNSTARVGIPLCNIQQCAEVVVNGNKVAARFDATHAWIDDVPPGKHSLWLRSAPIITQVSHPDATRH